MRWFYSISEEENLVKHGRPSLTTDKYSVLKWMNRTLGSHDGSAVKNPPANAGVFLPRKFNGQRSLVGYNPWGHKRAGHDLATKQQQQNTKNFKATIIDKHNKLNLFSEI